MKYVKSKDGTVFETTNPGYWTEAIIITAKEGKAAMKEQAKKQLLKWVKPGSEVCTILKHISSSGMSRRISVIIVADGNPLDVSGWVAKAIGARRSDKDGSIVMGGCGMDMGFAIVYNLGRSLWPQGTPEPHGKRNGEPDSDGGYALKHRWL